MSDICITETRNVETVWSIITNREVFNRICDDSWLAKPLDELKAIVRGIVENPANHIPLVTIYGKVSGCALCYALGDGCFDIHTCLLCRGAEAIEAGRAAIAFMFGFPEVLILKSSCPMNMRQTLFFALRCGFKRIGIAPHKWVKNGVEYDIMTVAKERGTRCL
jgi:hypothetical protein